MSMTMAPLDTIRQYQAIRLKHRSDSRMMSALRKKQNEALQSQNRKWITARKGMALIPKGNETASESTEAKDRTPKDNRARSESIANAKIEKNNVADFLPRPPPPGDVLSHLLDPFAFLHKSTSISSDPQTIPPVIATSTTPPGIATTITTSTPSTAISTASPPPLSPPGSLAAAAPSATSILTPLSTVTETPSSTAIPLGSPVSVDSPMTSTPDVPAVVTSSLSPTTSLDTSSTSLQHPLDTTSQPRNGYNPNADSTLATSTLSVGPTLVSLITIQQTASGSTTTSQAQLGGMFRQSNNGNDLLSPTAAHVLIAVGAIGAFIILVAAAFFILRMRNIDLLSIFRGREIRRGDNGWFWWYRKMPDSVEDPQLNKIFAYGSNSFPEDFKPAVPQKSPRKQFSPLIISKVDIPQTVRTPLLAGAQPQHITQGPRVVDATLYEASQTQAVFRQATQKTIKESNTLASTHINNSYDSNRASLSRNASNVNGPAGSQLKRMSEQSSLSSGFGDGQIIIPNSPPKPPVPGMHPTNNGRVRNFSWVTSVFQAKPTENRDTIYTTSSEETTGRYRTVNSWVAQQTRHVEKRQQIDRELPSLPQAPLSR